MPSLKAKCPACAGEYPAELTNCPTCVTVHTPHHGQPKEAHVVKAMTDALEAAGAPKEERDELTVLKEGPEIDGQKTYVPTVVDNRKRANAARTSRALAIEGINQGAKGAPKIHNGSSSANPIGAHLIVGDSIAQGYAIKAALEKKKERDAADRAALVKQVKDELAANPASAVTLAQRIPSDVIAEALKALGVTL